MKDLDVALIQMQVGRDRDENLARAQRFLEEAAARGAALAVLPEMFACPYEVGLFRSRAEPLASGPTCRLLSATAARLSIHIAGGSFPESSGGAVYNTATLFGPSGDLLHAHRKVHLFDVDVPGKITFSESRVLSAGDRLSVVETALGTLGLAICYDLRFPETFRALTLQGAELIVLPGAFNTTTGPAHWEPLLRCRAIENTGFVAACSPAPHPDGLYPAWGHSLVVDPWGTVLAEADRGEAIVTARLEARRLVEVRKAIPVLRQRRADVYLRG